MVDPTDAAISGVVLGKPPSASSLKIGCYEREARLIGEVLQGRSTEQVAVIGFGHFACCGEAWKETQKNRLHIDADGRKAGDRTDDLFIQVHHATIRVKVQPGPCRAEYACRDGATRDARDLTQARQEAELTEPHQRARVMSMARWPPPDRHRPMTSSTLPPVRRSLRPAWASKRP